MRNVIRNVGGRAAPDAALAEALLAMKGALNKVGNNVSQIAKRMNDAKNRGQALPFTETDHAEIRHLAEWCLVLRSTLPGSSGRAGWFGGRRLCP
ncbi:MAG: hypothetical protein AAFU86_11335 [Pseudomonadota bacterium]